jgi:hypothetical protein
MKTKNNLDLFRNEIIYELTKGGYIYDIMMNIYLRESGNETRCVEHMLKWYADVPRETLKLGAYSYHLINEYYSVLSEEAIIDADSKPIEWYTMFKTLIRLNIIPSRYSQMPLNEFMQIIRLKKENKK